MTDNNKYENTILIALSLINGYSDLLDTRLIEGKIAELKSTDYLMGENEDADEILLVLQAEIKAMYQKVDDLENPSK